MERIKQKIILKYNNTINFFSDTLTQSSTREGFIRYLKNTGWLFAGKMFGLLASFFVGVYVARYLGPKDYGLLNYVASFIGLFSIFSSFGIDSILNRELVKTPEKRDQLLGSGFIIKMVGSLISIFLITITIFFIEADALTNTLILVNSIVFILNAFYVIDIFFQSSVQAKKTVVIQFIALIINSLIKLALIFYHLGIIWFIFTYIIDSIIIASGLILSYKKSGLQISKWVVDLSIVKMLLKNSWPMMLSIAAISIYMKIDQIMIKNMIGNEANGIYSVAVKISEVWYFIPGIICTSLFPAIINAKKTNPIVYEKRLTKLYSLMIYLSVIIGIFISMFAYMIINNLFGNDYIGAVSVLKIHIWAGVGVFLGHAMAQYLIAENYTKIFFSVTLLGAIFNVLLNLILIPNYGIIGSAWATLIAYSVSTFSIILFKKSRRQILLMFKSIIIK